MTRQKTYFTPELAIKYGTGKNLFKHRSTNRYLAIATDHPDFDKLVLSTAYEYIDPDYNPQIKPVKPPKPQSQHNTPTKRKTLSDYKRIAKDYRTYQDPFSDLNLSY